MQQYIILLALYVIFNVILTKYNLKNNNIIVYTHRSRDILIYVIFKLVTYVFC